MAVQPILRYPHPVLKKLCHRVEKIDRKISELIQDLVDTMHEGPGSVGVAASQIGVTLRVCVVDVSKNRHGKENNHGLLCMINPEITGRSGSATMREGCIIFQSILQKLSSKTMITSGAGIREGAYLCDLLRSQHHKFSSDFKLSLRSFKDRFSLMEEDNLYIKRVSHLLFETLSPLHGMTEHFKYELGVAAELHNIGTKLGFYQNHLHSFYFILNNLNYGFSHEQKILIAMLIKYHVNKLPTQEDMTLYKTLLPDMQTVQWLSFILSLAKAINSDMRRSKISFSYQNHTLTIQAEKRLFLAREQIKQLIKPASFAIIIK